MNIIQRLEKRPTRVNFHYLTVIHAEKGLLVILIFSTEDFSPKKKKKSLENVVCNVYIFVQRFNKKARGILQAVVVR